MYTPNPEHENSAEKKKLPNRKSSSTVTKSSVWKTERNIMRTASEPSAPTVFVIWAARLRASPRRSKILHAPK